MMAIELTNLAADRRAASAPVATVVLMVLSAAAAAQDLQADPSATEGGRYVGLEEITVTARKRAESLQDAPVAVSALSAESLAKYDLNSLEKVSASIPQMSIARASNGSAAQISLRGIGSTFTSIGIEQSVASIVDGVYYGQGRVINEAMLDLDRVEILKGPQALFYGKNATAGVISFTTADPTDDLRVIARAGYEFTAEEAQGELIASGPITETLGFRVAVRGSKMNDGYLRTIQRDVVYNSFDAATGTLNSYDAPSADASGPRGKVLVARGTLKWQPNEQFTARLKATVNRDRQGNPAWNYVTFACPGGTHPLAPQQACRREFENTMSAVPPVIGGSMPFGKADGSLGNIYDSFGTTLLLDYELDNVTFTSVSNYYRNKNIFRIDGDYVASDVSQVWSNERAKYRAISQEFRALTTYDGPLNLMFGVYLQDTSLDLQQAVVLGGVENSAARSDRRYLAWDKFSTTDGKTSSVFGQVIWEITPEVEFTAGVRYLHETKKSTFVQEYINPLLTGLFVDNQPFGSDQTFDNWSPEATISWKATDDVMFYGAYKTGYKSGGFSNTGIQSVGASNGDFDFEAEKARGFEVGVKGVTLDNQLRYDLVAYNYEYTNLQVDFFNAVTTSFITTNAGSARTKGAELSLEFAPRVAPGLTLRGSLNYNRARYADYIAPCWGGQTIAEGCTQVRFGIPHQDLSGFAPTNAPKWTGMAGADYEMRLGSSFLLGVSADVRYSDNYVASAFGNPEAHQPSYAYVNASVRLRTDDDRWELAVMGRNLTDKFVVMGTADLVGTGSGTGTNSAVRSAVYGLAGFPRTIQAQLTYRL